VPGALLVASEYRVHGHAAEAASSVGAWAMLITEASGAILWKLSVPTHGAVEGRRLGRVSLCRCGSGRCSWRAGCCFGGLIPRRLACGYLHVVVLSETRIPLRDPTSG